MQELRCAVVRRGDGHREHWTQGQSSTMFTTDTACSVPALISTLAIQFAVCSCEQPR